jgi:glucokinase
MESILVADIGGTHISAGLMARDSTQASHVRKLKVADYPGLDVAIGAYFSLIESENNVKLPILNRAAFAVATPIMGDKIVLTNSDWQFSVGDLKQKLGLKQLQVINDFEALALSLPHLLPEQLRCVAGQPDPRQVMAVLGPGTGLGVAGICPIGSGRWRALPGEGGHVTLAAANQFEANLLGWVRERYPHVSAERLLSGIGMPLLYQAIAALTDKPVRLQTSKEIIQQGLAHADAVAAQTLDTFCAMLGGVAGNVALTLGARGGVFIGGGIVTRLGERFFQSAFRQRFEAKGRFAPYLAAIPTVLITDPHAALIGAARSLQS